LIPWQQFVPVDETMHRSTVLEKDDESVTSVSFDDRFDSHRAIPCQSVSATQNDRGLFNLSRMDLELLNELDEAVASIGRMYESPTPMVQKNAKCSKSTSHPELHDRFCRLHQLVNGRMNLMSDSGYSRFSSRSNWPSNRKRKRRDCLEQVVASTILRGGVKFAEIQKDFSDTQRESACCGAEFVLQDLRQACAILKCEIGGLHRPHLDDVLRERSFEPQNQLVRSFSVRVIGDGSTSDDTRDECSDHGNVCRMSWSNVDDAADNVACFAHEGGGFTISSAKQPYAEVENEHDDGGQVTKFGSNLCRRSLDCEEWTSFTANPFVEVTTHEIAQDVSCHFTVVRPWKTSELGWKQVPRSTVPIRASC
jgi:hypothetical protein